MSDACHTRASQVVLVLKNLPANAEELRDPGLIPGLGRPAGGGHSHPPHSSCLENPMDRGAWWAAVHGVTRVRHNWSDLAGRHTHVTRHYSDKAVEEAPHARALRVPASHPSRLLLPSKARFADPAPTVCLWGHPRVIQDPSFKHNARVQ